jgi:hypothetical protein
MGSKEESKMMILLGLIIEIEGGVHRYKNENEIKDSNARI